MEDVTINDFRKKKDPSDCNNDRGMLLVAHSGKVLMNIVTFRLTNYYGAGRILPEEKCGFRQARLTVDVLFVADCKSSNELGTSPCTCASSTSRIATT